MTAPQQSATPLREMLAGTASTLAASRSWNTLAVLLSSHAQIACADAELATLLAESYLRSGRARDARGWLEGSMHAIERCGDRIGLRRATNLLGAARFELGDLDAARAAFARALELGREDGDHLLVARATNNLGAIANIRGERDQALGMYALAITAYQQLGDVRGLAETNHNMGIAFRHKGEYILADNAERRAIEFAREAHDDRLIALALLGRAEILFAQGDAELAEAAARRAANDFGVLPDPIQQAGALRLAGAACLALGKGNAAREVLQTALALARLHGSALDEAEILAVCAKERVAANDRMRARLDGMTALEIFDRLGARDGCAATLAWLGEHAPAGDPS